MFYQQQQLSASLSNSIMQFRSEKQKKKVKIESRGFNASVVRLWLAEN